MSQDNQQDKGFAPWNGDLTKLFESLQNTQGSSTEHYNHIIAKLFYVLSQSMLVTWVDGVPYAPDPIRSKQISLNRVHQAFGYYGPNQSSRYLRLAQVTSAGNGLYLMRNAVITGVSTKARSSGNYTIEIRKNDLTTPLYTLNANGGSGEADMLDIDLNVGDFVQLYLNGSSVDHPLAFIELAWRN